MPFGLTGAPTCFNEMTAHGLGDLKDKLFQLFINDGSMPGEDFNQHIADLCTLLDQVRDRKLSLSANKTELFMTEAVCVGATVGPDGIKPDLTKLTAIMDWQQPILKGPQFNGTPFIVTTDGSGQAFGGSLAQKFTTK